VNPYLLPELVSDLPAGAETVAIWVSRKLEVDVVVVEPVPLCVTAACLLVASGLMPPAAAVTAFAATEEEPTNDDEVAVQVFGAHLLSYRCWHEARRLSRSWVAQ
jgi:hypothetical protein